MLAILYSLGMFIVDLFKPRRRLEVENLFLRHQLSIALRRAPARLRLRGLAVSRCLTGCGVKKPAGEVDPAGVLPVGESGF
jgi:hypothetical protein